MLFMCHFINLCFSIYNPYEWEWGTVWGKLRDCLFYCKYFTFILIMIHLHNFFRKDVSVTYYTNCFQNIHMTLLCQLETHTLHFSLELLCFVFFYYCHHSCTTNRGFWFNVPWGIISSFFTNTFLCIPLSTPIPFSGAPALAPSVGVTPQKAGKLKCRDEKQLLSHGALHGILVLFERQRQQRTQCYNFWRGSCLRVLVTLLSAHALLP